ncbi:3-hydroxyacyl-CoA dehydrogenase family protein [Haloquadratum walsbyi]|jgi:3-hydroxyacyl-CoA dehydrogenase (EC 1.1.1.35)|uniref:3-hydroxyacyl-CoA dehydrogenase n=1 Tax=Haloquadratum walsbyi J07HQW2 TaxID=1238425 RepID=U1NC29_9EURY|nr:3-hydroxyacyl-CoA dehydrogenase NAD-binding domain-containing protein [Haloquadratum walsbyi]ERG94450.1 MAG: 3-hydroxyacyl-CoA dehydrogenase [Haloquadratum walsbyi J07HQW2]
MTRDIESVEQVGVVGAGTMGSGIAQVAAATGYDVILRDIETKYVEDGLAAIADRVDRDVEAERRSENEAAMIQERISGTTTLDDLTACDLIVEAAVEDMDIKQDIFSDLDAMTSEDAILATNTSTLSITSIASVTKYPERVIGIHFMNPVPVMDGVELVAGEKTADDVLTLARSFTETLGKEAWVSDDKPGFVTNRILMPWINEGIRAYNEDVATKEDIDKGMTLGTNAPMGPLTLADHIGLDVCLHATETLYNEFGDRYKPAYLLKRKVEAGDLGKKTGKGFYEYE